jgi:hypothetical protein
MQTEIHKTKREIRQEGERAESKILKKTQTKTRKTTFQTLWHRMVNMHRGKES